MMFLNSMINFESAQLRIIEIKDSEETFKELEAQVEMDA